MKIKFGTGKDPEWTEIKVGYHEVLIQECYNGIGIETDDGIFGIAQRDGGIEVMLDGQLVWSSKEIESAQAASTSLENHESSSSTATSSAPPDQPARREGPGAKQKDGEE